MTAETRSVTIKVDADTTDATRKIRQLGREARQARQEISGSPAWVWLVSEALAVANVAIGVCWHSTFYVAIAAVCLLVARR